MDWLFFRLEVENLVLLHFLHILLKERVLILTPSIYMSRQIHHDLCFNENETFYEKMGLIKREDVENWCEDGLRIEKSDQIVNIRMHYLIICNAQKFGEKSNTDISKIPKDLFDLVIVDEGHRCPAKTWLSVVEHFNSPILFLLQHHIIKGNQSLIKIIGYITKVIKKSTKQEL